MWIVKLLEAIEENLIASFAVMTFVVLLTMIISELIGCKP